MVGSCFCTTTSIIRSPLCHFTVATPAEAASQITDVASKKKVSAHPHIVKPNLGHSQSIVAKQTIFTPRCFVVHYCYMY